MITIKRRFIIIIFIVLALSPFFIGREKHYQRTIYNAFDTVSSVEVYSAIDNTDSYEKTLKDIDNQLNIYNKDSLISRLNSGETVTLPPEITNLLATSISYTNMLTDYFDITVNPILKLWEDAEKTNIPPSEIEKKLPLVGVGGLYIDVENDTAKLTKEGASVNLGAVAKGYAAEILQKEIRADGVKSGLINLGGNVYAVGTKPDGGAWQIAVADPKNSGEPLLSVSVSNKAVITSGDYERSYEIDGKKYNHIVSPKTGYPVSNGIHSVTVIDGDSILCDVLSTAIFAAGKENAKAISERFGVDVIVIDDSTVYYTNGLSDKIVMFSDKYVLSPL